MYTVWTTKKFRRDIERCKRQGKKIALFKAINETLIRGESLPIKKQRPPSSW